MRKCPGILHKLSFFLIAACLIFFPHTVLAVDESAKDSQTECPPAESSECGPIVVGSKYRPDKRFLSEFTVMGGDYLGDEWQNTWDVGGFYSLYFNNTYGIGGGYLYSPIRFDGSSNFGNSIDTKSTHLVHGDLILSNDCAFLAGKTSIECELFLLIGGGGVMINHIWNPLAVFGGGMKIFTPIKWFAVRFDVSSFMHPTPNPTGNTFNADMSMTLGLSFFLPMKMNENAANVKKRPTLHH